MEEVNEKEIEKLNHLIAINEDGKQGYEKASEDVEDINMKSLFNRFSRERTSNVSELKAIVADLGGKPDDGGGPLGALHRTWIDLKNIFASGDRDAIIQACITGEEAAINAYNEALSDDTIYGSVREGLKKQLDGIQFALDSIKSHGTEEMSTT